MKKIYIGIVVVVMFVVGVVVMDKDSIREGELDVLAMETSLPDSKHEVSHEMVITNDADKFYVNGNVVDDVLYLKEDTNLTVNLVNNSDYELSMHFHGVLSQNHMDGVSGITQSPILPGESFEYVMNFKNKGSYMYHSHIDTVNQIHNELLFGQVVVADQVPGYDYSASIVSSRVEDVEAHMSAAATSDGYTINGDSSQVIKVSQKFNEYSFVNMSSNPLLLKFSDGVRYKVTNIDAREQVSDYVDSELLIGAAQRVTFLIENPGKDYLMEIVPFQRSNDYANAASQILFDTDSSEVLSLSDLDTVSLYDLDYETSSLELAEPNKKFEFELSMTHGKHMGWAINGEMFSEDSFFEVELGDVVELTLRSDGHMAEMHPFHLHGHVFEVVEKDGVKVDNGLVLDTVNVAPGEEIVIRLEANNPGIWPIHCHDLTHAEKGMMTLMRYKDYYSSASGMIHG